MTPANTNAGKAIRSIAVWNITIASQKTLLECIRVLSSRKIGVWVIGAAFDLVSYPIGVGVSSSVGSRTRVTRLR